MSFTGFWGWGDGVEREILPFAKCGRRGMVEVTLKTQDPNSLCGFLRAVVPDILGSVYSCNGC